MKNSFQNFTPNLSIVPKFLFFLALSLMWGTGSSAHVSPAGCSGSGLGITLFTNIAQGNIGDLVSYSAVVFNGTGVGPVVCDADGITASIITPDGVNHPITLVRTALSNGQSDFYPNVVTYTARAVDITVNGTLAATASDTGIIHQNITDSAGGGNQGLNVYVLNTLHIIKTVVNTGGGTAVPANFNVHVRISGIDLSGSPAVGAVSPGTLYSIIAGTYVVSEDVNASYARTFSGDCDATGSVILVGGNDKTCTITNTFIPPASITVTKTVVNNSGGTNVVGDFPLFVNAVPVVSGVSNVFPPGAYIISETPNANYTQTFSGDCDLTGHISIVPGDSKVCTITNDDIPPAAATINVVKAVVNDNGRTLVISDFPLFINGSPVVSGVTNVFTPGAYTVTETGNVNYSQTFSGDCDATGHLTLVPGNNRFCIITNNDIPPVPTPTPVPPGGGNTTPFVQPPVPPLIDVIKIPSPLALPNGPGPVTYTYTARNIGTVPMSNVTMVGDTCSPINLISGDTNNNSILEVNEIWVYQCFWTLSQTHTNTVVATGWANNISAVDIASATVVVGIPVVPPLIHVTKVPNPLALLAGGGLVTYTERITNPGTVALSNVQLEDNTCAPMRFISGDGNGDSRLDTNETWTYTCTTNLFITTTNTAVASGEANGLTVRDFAIATVVVAPTVPRLPNTGIPPDQVSSIWETLVAGSLIAVMFLLYLYPVRKIFRIR